MRKRKISIVGCGSLGSAVADCLKPHRLTLVDKDVLTAKNLERHLCRISGVSKAVALQQMVGGKAVVDWFKPPESKPELIVCCVDSGACRSLVNNYALENNVPVVYGSFWGACEVVEIYYVIPGKTPCWDCWRPEQQKAGNPRKYTDPDWDDTRAPHQEGQWGDVLFGAGVMYQVCLGLLGERDLPRKNLVLFGIHSPDIPARIVEVDVKKGCAICSDDMSQLENPRFIDGN